MSTKLRYLWVFAVSVVVTESLACSPHPDGDSEAARAARVIAAFDEAESVVIVQTQVVKQRRLGEDPRDRRAIEEAYLVVEEVLKGPLEVGATFQSKTSVDDGPCSRSLFNNPAWIYEVDETGLEAEHPLKLSGRWLLFLYADEGTHQVQGLDSPVELDGERDVETIKNELRKREEDKTPAGYEMSKTHVRYRGSPAQG